MSPLRRVDPYITRGRIGRTLVRMGSSRPARWFSRHVMWKLDPHVMRLTRGRVGMAFMLPTAVLETRGARTGEQRRNAVVYFHDGERVTIVASKMGAPENPAWLHNLVANPDVVFGNEQFRAHIIEDPGERERLWRLADKVLPAYAMYREMAGQAGRKIPIVQLVRR